MASSTPLVPLPSTAPPHDHSHEMHPEPDGQAKLWAIGLVATIVISLCSLGGAAMIPIFRKNKRAENRFFHIFVGLAVATLTADALLHMVPEILGLHSHDDHGDHGSYEGHDHRRLRQASGAHEDHDHSGHDHGEASHGSHGLSSETAEALHAAEEAKYHNALLHMSIILASIWMFYMLETVATCISEARDQKAEEAGESPYNAVATLDGAASLPRVGGGQVGAMGMVPLGKPPPPDRQMSKMSVTTKRRETIVCWGLKPIALMILLGDAIHNFADGLAIGAALNKSATSGLSTSLAIFCHELPHELGDFVVLLNSGLSVKKALLLNFLSALTAIAGLCVGIPVGGLEGARPYLFSLAAGMFLYVALVDMMHHLREMERLDPWWLTVLFQNIGLFLGFLIIFLIGYFEDDIKI